MLQCMFPSIKLQSQMMRKLFQSGMEMNIEKGIYESYNKWLCVKTKDTPLHSKNCFDEESKMSS